MDLSQLPVWALAIIIFFLRVADVSLGTFRTITVVQGQTALAVAVGFLEVGIWVVAITQVVTRLHNHPWLAVAYAGGFAAGNGIGIILERRLAIGTAVVRMITGDPTGRLEEAIAPLVRGMARFAGHGDGKERILVYAGCARRDLPHLLAEAKRVDPDLFYVVERFSQLSPGPLVRPTGWRSMFVRK